MISPPSCQAGYRDNDLLQAQATMQISLPRSTLSFFHPENRRLCLLIIHPS